MTKRLSISLPDDVAALIESERNVSAYVAEAIRLKNARELTRRALAAIGMDLDHVSRADTDVWRTRLAMPLPAGSWSAVDGAGQQA